MLLLDTELELLSLDDDAELEELWLLELEAEDDELTLLSELTDELLESLLELDSLLDDESLETDDELTLLDETELADESELAGGTTEDDVLEPLDQLDELESLELLSSSAGGGGCKKNGTQGSIGAGLLTLNVALEPLKSTRPCPWLDSNGSVY